MSINFNYYYLLVFRCILKFVVEKMQFHRMDWVAMLAYNLIDHHPCSNNYLLFVVGDANLHRKSVPCFFYEKYSPQICVAIFNLHSSKTVFFCFASFANNDTFYFHRSRLQKLLLAKTRRVFLLFSVRCVDVVRRTATSALYFFSRCVRA